MTTAVLVTGAAGGIGRAICERFKNDGHLVIGIDRNPSEAADRWLGIDLGDLGPLREAATELSREYTLKAVVHNAAVQPVAGAGDTAYDAVQRHFTDAVVSVRREAGGFEIQKGQRNGRERQIEHNI